MVGGGGRRKFQEFSYYCKPLLVQFLILFVMILLVSVVFGVGVGVEGAMTDKTSKKDE